MDLWTRVELKKLVAPHDSPCVSILLPTRRGVSASGEAELYRRAWPIASRIFETREREDEERSRRLSPGTVALSETRRPWDEDLFDRAAVETLAHGGVYALPKDRMPDGHALAAIFRY